MSQVRVYNLTDVSTPTLEKHHLLKAHIAIGTRMCNPGEFVEQEDTPSLRSDINFLVSIGALAVDQLPPPYVLARTSTIAAQNVGPLPVHIGHLNVQETKVAADPPPAPAPEAAPEPAPVVDTAAVKEAPVEPVVASKSAPQGKNNRR
jgi:hypothetical protein